MHRMLYEIKGYKLTPITTEDYPEVQPHFIELMNKRLKNVAGNYQIGDRIISYSKPVNDSLCLSTICFAFRNEHDTLYWFNLLVDTEGIIYTEINTRSPQPHRIWLK